MGDYLKKVKTIDFRIDKLYNKETRKEKEERIMVTIKNDNLEVTISELGAQLQSVKNKETEFLWNGDENVWSERAPVLFPVCGGLKDDKFVYNNKEYTLAKHGFAKDMEFCVVEVKESTATFMLSSNEETKKSYPFDFNLYIKYELKASELEVTYNVENTGNGEMLFSIGAHEGYYCPEGIEEYYLEFENNETLYHYPVTENGIDNNIKELFLDNSNIIELKYDYFDIDALIFKNVKSKKVSLIHKGGKRKITLDFSGFSYFLVWTAPKKYAKYVCLEPWNGFPDTVGSNGILSDKEGINRIEANGSFEIVHKISFEG